MCKKSSRYFLSEERKHLLKDSFVKVPAAVIHMHLFCQYFAVSSLRVQQVQRLPGLPSSNLMSDVLTGRLDSIGFEDILSGCVFILLIIISVLHVNTRCLFLHTRQQLRSIVMSTCVSVCLSTRISPEPRVQSLPIFCACCLWPWLGPPASL